MSSYIEAANGNQILVPLIKNRHNKKKERNAIHAQQGSYSVRSFFQ